MDQELTRERMVQGIVDAMKAEIAKYGLELMKHYPNDIEEIDRNIMRRLAYPGMQFAWVVGDCHSHIVPLGIHASNNETPASLTNLANNDRFYLMTIGRHPGELDLKEMKRADFGALGNTRIPYKGVGATDSFWLYKNDSRIGTCVVKRVGSYQDRSWKVELAPMAGASALDRAVLAEWGGQAVIKTAGTVLVGWEIDWKAPIELAFAA